MEFFGNKFGFTGGNLGIGSNDPVTTLDVNGYISLGNRLQATVDGSNMFWTSLRGTGTEIDRVAIGINGNPTTGLVNSLSFNTNSANRMFIASTGNVGIGTNAPEPALHIYNSSTNPMIGLQNGANAIFGIQCVDNSRMRLGTWAGSNTLNDYLVITSAGNVGIGTNAPSSTALLDVNGNIKSAISFAQYANYTLLGASDTNKWFKIATFQYRSYGDFLITWTQSGEHGHIRFSFASEFSNTPSLSITECSIYNTTITAIRLSLYSTDYNQPGFIEIQTKTPFYQNVDVPLNIYLLSTDPAIPITLYSTKTAGTSTGYTYHTLSTASNFGKICNGNSFVLLTSGNVGIGATGPVYKFEVRNTGYTLDSGYVYSATHLFTSYATNDPVVSHRLGWYDDYYDIRAHRAGSGTLQRLSFAQGTTERMCINFGGLVGIGTTNPGTTLHVHTSAASTTSGVLSSRYYLAFVGDNQDGSGTDLDGPWYGLGWSGIPGISGPNYPCLAGWSGVAMRSGEGYIHLTGSGNVGIGTTNSNYKLKIEQGLSNNNNGLFISNTNYGSMQGLDISMVNTGSGNFNSYASIQGYTSGVSASTPIILQASSGSVGIGITNPSGKIHIYGQYYGNQYSDTYSLNVNAPDSFNGDGANTVYSGNSINLKAGDLTWGGGSRSYGSQIYIGGGYSINGAINSAEIKMYTGGGERMRISGGGNVGIGTVSTDQKLHIYGNIRLDARAAYYSGQTANTTYNAGTWYTILPVGNLNVAGTYLISFVWNASPGTEPWGLGGAFFFNSGSGTNDVYGGQPGMTGAAIPTSYHAINNNTSDWQIYVRGYANGFMTSPGIQFKVNAALPAGSWIIKAHIISY
jgi:hypothetical protein